MAKDPEQKAADDELAARRRKQEESDAAAAAAVNDGKSLEQLEAEGGIAEADDGQLFVWEQGQKVTLGTLVSRNVTVEHVFVFGGKRVKGRGGLMTLDEQPILVVRGMSGGVKVIPTHDDNGKVTKVTIEQHVLAQVVNPADSDESMALLAPIIEKRKGQAA